MPKACLYLGPERPVAFEDVDVRAPGEGEVRVAIRAAGLCHSDVSAIDGTYSMPAPMVMGHEGAGVVESVGPGVRNVDVGDHVVVSALGQCGFCAECESGRPTECHQPPSPGTPFRVRGEPAWNFANASTFSELTVVRESSAVRVPTEIPFAQAALIGCGIITGVGAVLNRARVETGDTVAVFGAGGIGLNIVQGALLAGASRIIVIDLLPQKLEWARDFGATDTIEASSADVVDVVKELTGGRGVRHAFEAVGHVPVIEQALDVLAPGGTLTVVGVPKLDARFEVLANALRLDRSVLGCRYGTARPQRDFPMLAQLYLDGRLKIDELITRHYPLRAINDAIADLEKGDLARGVFDVA